MLYRLAGVIVSGSVGLLLGGQLVIAADRIDLFDTNSNRTGYIVVDPKSGRFDTYDTKKSLGLTTDQKSDLVQYLKSL